MLKTKVLIIEDDWTLPRKHVVSLKQSGFDVVTVDGSVAARAMLASGPVDVVCLDVRLPDGSGLDLLKEIRQQQPMLPILVMTADDGAEMQLRAAELGASCFLRKPFSLATLKGVLDRWRIEHALAPGEAAPRRVMMYSHDGFGLGHFRRNLNIASRFVREAPDSSVLLVASSPTSDLFDLPPGVDLIKLPSIVKVATGAWRPRTLRVAEHEAKAIRESMIEMAARLFRPDVFLVDHVPAGVWNELLPTLSMLRSLPRSPAIVLGLRDILDRPSVVRTNWADEGTYEVIRAYYDRVFIYGEPDVFDTATMYGLDRKGQRVDFCGYVCSTENRKRDPETVRAGIPAGRDKLVVVTAGGGADAFPMMMQSAAALEALRPDATGAIFITGPLMPEEKRDALRAAVDGLPARVRKSVPDSLSYLEAADLVITMAGYNTLMEAISLRCNVVVIPREGPSAEQKMRARQFAGLGLFEHLEPEAATPEALAAAIRRRLAAPPSMPEFPIDGIDNVVAKIEALIEARDIEPMVLRA